MVQGVYKFHQYQVVGRHLPRDNEPEPPIFRMKLWANDPVRAKSKFWYFLRKLRKVKKANGQILSVNEIFERSPTTIKNFGIWVRYQSRTGYHNMYKEYRDVTLNGAVEQMYQEMASRHRVRFPCINIIKTATIANEDCKRDNTKQFHEPEAEEPEVQREEGEEEEEEQQDDEQEQREKRLPLRFPLTRKLVRPSERKYKTVFKAVRPNVAMY